MDIKRNIIYSGILTTSNYIFPLIVYPYVARVLGVSNIGLCGYIDSIIDYFILFSMMGISILGTRQIAMDKGNKEDLSKSFSSLLTLNAITTFLALSCLIALTYSIKELHENKEMMWFGAIKLVSNFFLIEWFYKGLENFKFITYRTIIIRCLFVASVFIFVRRREDYQIYYLLTAFVIGFNAIINTNFSKNFVSFKLKNIYVIPYIKPFIYLGAYSLFTSLYTTFNIVYLGSISSDTQVGYYTTASKLYSILLALFTGVTTVLMPRMSNLLFHNKVEEFRKIIHRCTKILFSFSIPLVMVSVIFAPQIIRLISGPGYEGAIIPMRIIMPLILIIGYEQIQIIQCLMPLKQDKIIMRNAFCGALLGIFLNLILVPHLFSIGSAITWFCSECAILILSQQILFSKFNFKFSWSLLGRILINNIFLGIILLILYRYFQYLEYWKILILAFIITILYTIVFNLDIRKKLLYYIRLRR